MGKISGTSPGLQALAVLLLATTCSGVCTPASRANSGMAGRPELGVRFGTVLLTAQACRVLCDSTDGCQSAMFWAQPERGGKCFLYSRSVLQSQSPPPSRLRRPSHMVYCAENGPSQPFEVPPAKPPAEACELQSVANSNMPGEAMSAKWGIEISRREDCMSLCNNTLGCQTAVFWTRARPEVSRCWLYTAPYTSRNTPSDSPNRSPIQVMYCADTDAEAAEAAEAEATEAAAAEAEMEQPIEYQPNVASDAPKATTVDAPQATAVEEFSCKDIRCPSGQKAGCTSTGAKCFGQCRNIWQCGAGELCNRHFGYCEEDYVNVAAAVPVFEPSDRVAVSADGNHQDQDDIGGTPLTLALLDAAGLKSKLVFYGYANHIWAAHGGGKSDPDRVFSVDGVKMNMEQLQKKTIAESITLYEYRPELFVDEHAAFVEAQGSLERSENSAVKAMSDAVLASTESSKLWIIAAGPLATIYYGLLAASKVDATKLRHVRVISHSVANNEHALFNHKSALDTKGGAAPKASWADLKQLVQDAGGLIYFGGDECKLFCGQKSSSESDVKFPEDQNANLDFEGGDGRGGQDWSVWHWMRDSPDPRVEYLWTTMRWSGVPDVSDAGMMYYALTGDDMVTPRKLEAFLGQRYDV